MKPSRPRGQRPVRILPRERKTISAIPFSLSRALNSVSAIVGVNPGYAGSDFAVNDADAAAEIVSKQMRAQALEGNVLPGYVLYPQERGCPRGGEAVGVAFAQGGMDENLLERFNRVRLALNQATVSVIAGPGSGTTMSGFVAPLGTGGLRRMALDWQEAAARLHRRSGFHVSGVVYRDPSGTLYGQAEANPTRISDLAAWERDAAAIVRALAPEFVPTFRQVGYHYLKG